MESSTNGIEVIQSPADSAFARRIVKYKLKNLSHKDFNSFFPAVLHEFKQITQEILNRFNKVKVFLLLEAVFVRPNPKALNNSDESSEQVNTFYLSCKTKTITQTTNLDEWFRTNVVGLIMSNVDGLQENGSGWTLQQINQMEVTYNKSVSLNANSYIPLPKKMSNKKAIVNVQNTDDEKCFLWAILSALYPAKDHIDRVMKYARYENELNMQNIEYPVSIDDIDTFETNNPEISVNVYILDKQPDANTQKKKTMVVPIRLAENVKEKHVNLLLLYDNNEYLYNEGDENDHRYNVNRENDIDNNGDENNIDTGNSSNTKLVTGIQNTTNAQMKKIFYKSPNIKKHYCWIKNLSALVHDQITKHKGKIYICDRCLNYFSSKRVLEKHIDICKSLCTGKVDVPNKGNRWINFKNLRHKLEVPFIVYADFESLLVPMGDSNENTNNNFDDDDNHVKTPKGAYQKHIPNSVAFYFHARPHEECKQPYIGGVPYPKSFFKSFTGPNCVEWFVNELYQIAKQVYPVLNQYRIMPHSPLEDRIKFQNATICHICKEPFIGMLIDEHDPKRKVRDHCHLTGKFRGAAHSDCNLKYQVTKVLPVVFHNLDYDSHFIIEELATKLDGSISVIPKTDEKYISFTKTFYEQDLIPNTDNSSSDFDSDDDNDSSDSDSDSDRDSHTRSSKNTKKCKIDRRFNLKLRFIDSLRFLQCSLGKLAKFLPNDKKCITRKEWKTLNDDEFELLTMKGVYPYSYMDGWDKMNKTELPTIHEFFDSLNGEPITDEEYEHAKTVWRTFNIQSMREYTELYLKTDVLLLADIFENFRQNCIKLYELDPAHYFTLPGYSWDCMLKTTKVRIELLTDIDKVLFVERGIRGGISQCSKRYCQANNKYMAIKNKDDEMESENDDDSNSSNDNTKQNDTAFNSNKLSNYLMYFDVNNLYGWAMSQELPISDFEWVKNVETQDVKNIESEIMNTPSDSETGYMLEVDLKYPSYLHDLHNDYPFCPEHMKTSQSNDQKLVLTLRNKYNYILHYETLKLALKHGLQLMRVHKILKFKQSRWLEKYIMLNTHQRTLSKNDFEKNLYKLMNNAVFGKSMQNVRKQADIKLINTWDGRAGAKALIARPTFKRCTIFNENLVAIEMLRTNTVMNKPIIVGASILEISKLKMYNFHYEFMLKNYLVENCRIAYTDTDSFVYDITCEDVYKDLIRSNYEQFDTSDFAQPNPFDIQPHNKKVIGVMKDENSGQIMREFVGLRSKMYAIRLHGDKITKKAKGVKKSVLKKEIQFEDFMECLLLNSTLTGKQSTFKSHLHQMYTINTERAMLDAKDDKRFVTENGIHTLALGHYRILYS